MKKLSFLTISTLLITLNTRLTYAETEKLNTDFLNPPTIESSSENSIEDRLNYDFNKENLKIELKEKNNSKQKNSEDNKLEEKVNDTDSGVKEAKDITVVKPIEIINNTDKNLETNQQKIEILENIKPNIIKASEIVEVKENDLKNSNDKNELKEESDYFLADKWYPLKIVKKPTKLSYKVNEQINLSGLKIRFVKYSIGYGNRIYKEFKDIEMNDLKPKLGWKLSYKVNNINSIMNNVEIKMNLVDDREARENKISTNEKISTKTEEKIY